MALSENHRDSPGSRPTGSSRPPAPRGDRADLPPPQPGAPDGATVHLSIGPVPARIGSRRREPRSGTPALVFVVDGRVTEPPGGAGRFLDSGAVALFDGAAGRQSWLSDGPVLTVPLDREVLSGHAWPDGRRDVLVLPHAGSEVLRDLLESMVRHAADLTRRQAVTATTTVGALVRDALGADGAGSDPAQPADRVGQILAFIAANSHRTDITPETISAATGVSRSVLYRLLEPFGGVAACVKQRRLDAMRRALAQRNDCRSIAEIAADSGFLNSSHAHRNFREAFGVTPGDFRRDGLGPPPAAAPPAAKGRRIPR